VGRPSGWLAQHRATGWYVALIVTSALAAQHLAQGSRGVADAVRVAIVAEVVAAAALGTRVMWRRWRRRDSTASVGIWMVTVALLVEAAVGHVLRWGRPPDFRLGYNAALVTLALWAMVVLERSER
jgi:hypothetical protein